MAIRAARWKTVSTPAVICLQKWESRMSPLSTSISLRQSTASSHPQLLKELYWDRALTLQPCCTSISVRCEPINPSAPVTRTFCICLKPAMSDVPTLEDYAAASQCLDLQLKASYSCSMRFRKCQLSYASRAMPLVTNKLDV